MPWTDLLARFIQQAARSDYTWSQPKRRYIHQDIYFPALVSDQLPEMAVAIDTSGSVRPGELERFDAELSAILSMHPATVHILYSDLTVSRHETVSPWDLPFDFTPKGGGGTDFRRVFQFINENRITPFCLIFFSDMECRLFPIKAPDYPVLWIRTGQGGYPAHFGDMIDLKPEKPTGLSACLIGNQVNTLKWKSPSDKYVTGTKKRSAKPMARPHLKH